MPVMGQNLEFYICRPP